MKVLTLHHPHAYQASDFPPLAMALGYFDGIHLGHQKVIKTAKSLAEEHQWKSAVMTFDPHPSVVLSPKHKHVEHITPLEEKIRLIKGLGIDYLIIVRFTSKFAGLDPQEFVNEYIIGLNVRHVVAGFDFTYGKFGKGTMTTLPHHSNQKFTCTMIEKLVDQNGQEKVSSTLTRKLLKEGEFTGVYRLLGRYYRSTGIVIHGGKTGNQFGLKAAEIKLKDEYLVPQNGVYAVRFFVNNNWFKGVCKIDAKPLSNSPNEFFQSIEVHIFDFNDSIYGEEVIIEWHARIRNEQEYDGIDSLNPLMEEDRQSAMNYFKQFDL